MTTELNSLYYNIFSERFKYSLGEDNSQEKVNIFLRSHGLAQNVTFQDQLFLKEVIEPAIEQYGVDAIRKVFNEPPAFATPLLTMLTELGAPLAVAFAVKEIGADVNIQGMIIPDYKINGQMESLRYIAYVLGFAEKLSNISDEDVSCAKEQFEQCASRLIEEGLFLKSAPPICSARNDKGGDGMMALLIELGANLDLPYAYIYDPPHGIPENPSIQHTTVRESLRSSMEQRIGMPLAMIGKFSGPKPSL